MLFNLFWLNLLESVNCFCGMSRVAEWPRHAPLPLHPSQSMTQNILNFILF